MAVILDMHTKSVALEVREALGIQKVVKKTVDGDILNATLFEGASVSGTGRVMLILNEEMLVRATG
jgi:chemotaxis protein histidine kinase CheA